MGDDFDTEGHLSRPVLENFTVNVCRMVPKTESFTVNVQECKTETRTRQVPVTTYKTVAEVVTEKVAVKVWVPAPVECCAPVSCCP